jgi:hypothetical protein
MAGSAHSSPSMVPRRTSCLLSLLLSVAGVAWWLRRPAAAARPTALSGGGDGRAAAGGRRAPNQQLRPAQARMRPPHPRGDTCLEGRSGHERRIRIRPNGIGRRKAESEELLRACKELRSITSFLSVLNSQDHRLSSLNCSGNVYSARTTHFQRLTGEAPRRGCSSKRAHVRPQCPRR